MRVMRFFIQIIVCTVLFMSFNNVFAEDAICPASDIIKNITFKSAYKVSGGTSTWTLVSDAFNYKNNQFNVIFTSYIPTISPDVALKKGQEIFVNQVNLYPTPHQTEPDDGYIFCKYLDSLKGDNGYQVEVSNPPYPYPL